MGDIGTEETADFNAFRDPRDQGHQGPQDQALGDREERDPERRQLV